MIKAMGIYKKYAKLIKSGKIKNEADLFKMLQENEEGVNEEVIKAAKEKVNKK